MKRRTTLLLLLSLLFCLAVAGCGDKQSKPNVIVLDEEIHTSYEYTGEEIRFPSAHVESADGEMVSYDVKYILRPETGDPTEKDFPSFNAAVGKYKLEYVYEDIRVEKEFTVADTTPPALQFTGVTGGVFLQDMAGGIGQLPTADITDLSEDKGINVQRSLQFRNSAGVTSNVEINEINLSYPVSEFGTFTYTVTATDAYDNSVTDSISWRIKDRNWAPSAVKEGYLADFDEEGYINFVESGEVDQYYKITDISEDWMQTFEGATGVLKVTMGFNHAADYAGYNTVRLRLPAQTAFTKEQAKNKYLAVRMYIDGDIHDQIIFGGNDVKIDENNHGITNCSKFAKQGVSAGKWITVYYDLANMKTPSGQETLYDETDNKCHAVQLCFKDDASYKGTNEHMIMYVDGIALADKLGSADITVSQNKAQWQAVDKAESYLVEINGSEQIVTDTEVALTGESGYIKVTPRKDEMTVLDGDVAMCGYGLNTNGYLAKFDNEAYAGLIGRDIDDFHQYYAIEKELISDGLKLKVDTNSISGKGAGFSVTLAEKVTKGTSEYLVIRLKFDNEKFNFLYIHDGLDAELAKIPLEDKSGEFFEIKIDIKNAANDINKLRFKFGDMSVLDGSVPDGIEVVLGEIRALTYLVKPQATDSFDTKTISWAAVPNAAGYIVKINGVEKPMITQTSYNYEQDGKGTFAVKAVGNGNNRIVDSEYAAEIVFDMRAQNVALSGFTYNADTKTLGWNDIEHNSGYEVKIGNGEAQKVTANSFDCSGLENGATLYVRGIGDDTLRDTEWATVKLLGNAAQEVKGEITLTVESIGYDNKNLIQFNNLPLDLFEGDANDGAEVGIFGNVTYNEESISSVTVKFFGNANKTFMLSGFDATEGDVLSIGAGTVFYQNGNAYVLAETFGAIFLKDKWFETSGEFTMKKVHAGTSSYVQISDVELGFTGFGDGQLALIVSGTEATLGGEKIAVTAKYFDSKILQLDGAFAEGKVLVLSKGMILASGRKAYALGSEFSLVFADNEWNVVRGAIEFDKVGWGNNSIVQLPEVACDELVANVLGQDTVTNNIAFIGVATVNGASVRPSVSYYNDKGMLQFASLQCSAGDVFMIGAGSVIYQSSSKTAYIVSKDMFLCYNGGGDSDSWNKLAVDGEITLGLPTAESEENAVKFSVTGLADGDVDTKFITVSGANGAVSVTASVQGGVLTVSGEFGGAFVLKAGALLKQGEKYFIVSDDVSILYQSGVWGAISGSITITSVGATSNSYIQVGMTLDITEGNFEASSIQATMNGESYTFSTVKYHASGVLEFQTVGHNPAVGDLLVVKAGSLFVRDGKFFRLETDFAAMIAKKANSEELEWKYAVVFAPGTVGYNTNTLIQIGNCDWGLNGDTIVLQSSTFVNFDTKVQCSDGVTLSNIQYHPSPKVFQPQFTGVEANKTATVTIKQGSAVMYNNVCYVIAEDYVCEWDGTKWSRA